MKKRFVDDRNPVQLSFYSSRQEKPLYLSESVQSAQSDRKTTKSRINIGFSCEPISKNNRLSTGAIGSAARASGASNAVLMLFNVLRPLSERAAASFLVN